jgi:hypothetical protein
VASYGAVIEVSVKGQQALDRLEGSARKIEGLIQGIKQQKNIFDQAIGSDKTRELKRNLENIVATFAGAKEGARQFKVSIGGTEQTINMYSKTLAGLNSQLGTFRAIANNATVGTDQYRNAVVAANKVSNEFARTQAKAFKVSTSVSGMNVEDVIALGKSIPDTIEGLTFYQAALEDVLRTVKIGSGDFRALEEAIASTGARLSSARLTGQKTAITPAAGPATRIDTVASFEKRAAYAQKVADLEYKQLVTGQQIVQAKLKETQQEDLQNRLAQASEALQRNELDLAKRLTTELRNQRIAYERANRAEEALMRPTSMVAGAAESVTGRRPGGLPPVPGSRAAWLATGGVQAPPATQKTAADALDQSIGLQKRYNNLLTSAQIIEQKSLTYKAKGLETDQQIATVQNLIQNIRENGATATKQYLDALDNILNSLRNELKLTKAVADARRAGAAGQGKQPGTGKTGTATATKGGAGLQNALIGGAFPLLFGGGFGAVAGGFAGGFIPGNPMMSIVTSAVGTIFDRIVAGARVAGEAVRTLDTTIQHMSENSLFSSKQTEFLAQKLEEYGRYSLAANVVQKELNRKIGVEGVASLQRLGESSSALNKAWAQFNLELQAAISGPLAGLLDWLTEVVKVTTGGPEEKVGLNTPGQPRAKLSLLGDIPDVNKQAKKVADIQTKLSDEQISKLIADGEKLYTELADLERELNDKKRQYAEQYFDMSLALTRQQYDLTEQLQRKAFDTQIQALQKELELLKKQGEIQVQIARNAAEARRLGAAPGADVETALLSAIDEYRARRQEIDNESGDRERQFKLEMIKLDVENERYKLDVAKSIARTNFDNQTKIARINQEINKQNEAVSRKLYERRADIISAELAVLRGQTLQLYAQAEAALQQSDLTQDQKAYFETLRDRLAQAFKETAALQAKKEAGALFTVPGAIPQMGALPSLTADTQAIDAANNSLQRRIVAYRDLLATQGKLTQEESARLQLLAQIEQAYIRPLNDIVKAQNEQLITQKFYTEEINKGSITALAGQLAAIEALFQPSLQVLNATINELEAQKALNQLTKDQADLLDVLIERRDRLSVAAGAATAGAFEQQDPSTRAQAAITAIRGELNDLTDPINAAVTGANAIGDAFSQTFQGLVTGTQTAQEALTSFFKTIGEAFVSMAAEIIAKQLVMITLQTILKALGVATGSSSGVSKGSGGGISDIGNWQQYASEGSLTGTLGVTARAVGGPVTANAPYVVGERGPELFVPGTNGGVMSNSDLRSAMGAAPGSAGGPVLNMNFETTSIGGVEYVSRDQLEAAMAATRRRAASDGAKRGMSMTLDKLQQSPGTRNRVGMR